MNKLEEVNQKEIKSGSRFYKWLILISFSLNSFTNEFSYGVLLATWPYVPDYFNSTQDTLNWFFNLYFITAILFSFPINPFIIKNFGGSQILSCLLTAGGLWVIAFAHSNYLSAFFSLTLIGLGQSAFYQVYMRDLSKLWFEPQERIMSTFIGQYINSLGTLIGYSFSSYYFYEIYDQQEFNDKLQYLMTIVAVFALVAAVANFVALKKNDNQSEKLEFRENTRDSLLKIFANQEGLFDLISISISKNCKYEVVGWSWNYTIFFNSLQQKIGQSYLDQVMVSIFFQIGTIVAAYICTVKLSKQSKKGLQPQYDSYIKFTLGIGYCVLSMEIILYNYLPPFLLTIFSFFIGAGTGGLYSLFLESLMEKHYPVQELTIGTIMFCVASIEGILMDFILEIPSFQDYGFMISCFFTIGPFCYIMIFYETQYKRFEQEG